MATYGPQGLTGEQISNFISQNIGNPEAIASAAQQFGISAQDIAAVTPYTVEQQAQYFAPSGVGIAGLPSFASITPSAAPTTAVTTSSTVASPATATGVSAPIQDQYGVLSGTVLAGDSWLSGNQALPTQLASVTGDSVINAAQGGSTSNDVLNRLNTFVGGGGSFAPGSTVVLNVGGNDFLTGIDRNTTRGNIDQIVSTLGSMGVNVVLSGAPNISSVEDITAGNLSMDPLYSDIASRHDNVTLVDSMSNILGQSGLRSEDVIHTNVAGEQAFNQSLVEALTPPERTYGNLNLTAQNIRDLVTQYIDDPGVIARGMQNAGITEQDLSEIFSGTFSPEQITSYLSSPAAKLYATSYGDGSAPLTARESYNYLMANANDPTRIAQAAISRGYSAQDLTDIMNLFQPGAVTLADAENYLSTGRSGLNTAIESLVANTFGTSEQQNQIKDVLFDQWTSAVAGEAKRQYPNATEDQIIQLVDRYIAQSEETPDSLFTKTFGAEALGDKSLEDIESLLKSSGVNKYQEANRLATIAQNYLGYDQDQQVDLYNRAMTGALSEGEKNIFEELLNTGTLSNKTANDLLSYAALTNPDSPYFQQNPDKLALYTPLSGVITKTSDTKWGGGSGQYGYYEGAPILNADVARSIVGDHGSTRNLNAGGVNYSDIAKTLGMDFAAHGETTAWRAGRSVVGVDFDKQYLQDLTAFEDAQNRGEIVAQMGEEGLRYYKAVPNPNSAPDEPRYIYQPVQPPTPPESVRYSGGSQVPTTTAEAQQRINSAAETLGIDTEGKSVEQLFDEITERTTGLYQVIGNSEAIDRNKFPDAKNHLNAVYEQVGNKLVLKDANFFHADAPKKKKFLGIGGTAGEMLTGIASIPGIAELMLLNPATAIYYPVVKGVQVAGLSGDLEAGLKAGAKAWVMQQGAQMANEAIGNYLIDQGFTDINIVNTLSEIGGNVAANVGLAAIDGNSISDAGLESLVATLISSQARNVVGQAGIPRQYQAAAAQILTDAVLKNDLEKSLSRIAIKEVTNGIKNVAKTAKREMEPA